MDEEIPTSDLWAVLAVQEQAIDLAHDWYNDAGTFGEFADRVLPMIHAARSEKAHLDGRKTD